MDDVEDLSRYFELTRLYSSMFESYLERGVVRELDPNDKELTKDDTSWPISHYFHVGADALRIIVSALCTNRRPPPAAVLDLPSGSGRVTRHLRAFFPEARVVACDLYEYHIEFCHRVLGAEPILSVEHIGSLNFPLKFDLVFCGSLLTHLPEPLFHDTLDMICRSLKDDGIAIVTLHGRVSDFFQAERWKYLANELYNVARQDVERQGFGYVNYQHDFKESKFNKQDSYGITLVRPSWVMRALEARTDVRVLSYTERCWDDHQDVVVFGKPPVTG
jgi:SAM-dependent methyltransferase